MGRTRFSRVCREQNAQLLTSLSSERKQAEEKAGTVLRSTKNGSPIEFKNLANEILKKKHEVYGTEQKVNLNLVLKPLSGQIKDFQKRVEGQLR